MRFTHAAAAIALAAALPAHAAPVELVPANWQAGGQVAFTRDAAHPHGLMHVKSGGARLLGVEFADGIIEYDIDEDADDQGVPAIRFRQHGNDEAESFYLRTDADCPASIECVQYAPVSHGNEEWDVYPEFQAGAPVHRSGWNHVKLVLSGQRMDAYVNHESTPSLRVGRLVRAARSGTLELRGDATYANLAISPGAPAGLDPAPLPGPSDTDPRFLRRWQLAPVATLGRNAAVDYARKPAADGPWAAIAAEPTGFVNIGRDHGTAGGAPDLAWLRTTVVSERAQTKHVALGWAREIWVFVNGRLAFADRNLYYPAAQRKPPMGRMALGNGGFDLALAAGSNRIEIAISDDLPSARHYGWGFAFRIDDLDGVTVESTARM